MIFSLLIPNEPGLSAVGWKTLLYSKPAWEIAAKPRHGKHPQAGGSKHGVHRQESQQHNSAGAEIEGGKEGNKSFNEAREAFLVTVPLVHVCAYHSSGS